MFDRAKDPFLIFVGLNSEPYPILMALGLFWSSVCLCVFVSVFIYDRMGGFQSKNRFPVNGKVNSLPSICS